VHRYRFDADPDPGQNFHVDANPDLDRIGIKTMPIPASFTFVEKSYCFTFIRSMVNYNTFPFSSMSNVS
jgi:hypothetical protein